MAAMGPQQGSSSGAAGQPPRWAAPTHAAAPGAAHPIILQQWQQVPHPQPQQQAQPQMQPARAAPNPLADLVAAHFPPIAYGFAYGSGVFAQPHLPSDGPGPATPAPAPLAARGAVSGPMVDFIFVVDDPEEWHARNLERNARHYSAVAWLGAGAVASAAESLGAGVWFNTLVPLGGRLVKYGVIGRRAFLEDLTAWRHLYVPGRLHKPVLPLVALPRVQRAGGAAAAVSAAGSQQGAASSSGASGGSASGGGGSGGGGKPLEGCAHRGAASEAEPAADLSAALEANLASALRTALLLSPGEVPLRDVVRRVAGLSYEGDVRMGLAEDSRKVERIVAGSFPGFCDLYLPLLWDPTPWGAPGGGAAAVTLEGGPGDGPAASAAAAAAAATGGAAGAQQGAAHAAVAQLRVRQDTCAEARVAMLAALPAALLGRVAERAGVRRPWAAAAAMQVPLGADATLPWPRRSELSAAAASWRRDVAWAAVQSGRYPAMLHGGLRSIIRSSSARQAVVGVLSAGAVKSARYLGAKLAKAWHI
jgi:uncharacterized membrane protein YgcG